MTKEQISIIAIVISFIGNALFTLSSLFHSKKKIIATQSFCHGLNGAAQLMQGGYGGTIQDFTMLVKNFVLLFVDEARKKFILFINVVCIIVALVFGIISIQIWAEDKGWFQYLPVGGMFVYSVCSTFVFAKRGLSKNFTEVLLKSALIFNGICQCIYGILLPLIPNTIFNALTIVISIYSIIRIAIKVHKEKKNPKDIEDFNQEENIIDEEQKEFPSIFLFIENYSQNRQFVVFCLKNRLSFVAFSNIILFIHKKRCFVNYYYKIRTFLEYYSQ